MPALSPPSDWDTFSDYWAAVIATQDTAAPWPQPHQIHCFPQVASTNQTLWQYLGQGHPIGTTTIAQQQTAGRGQWGRRWTSAAGGLYLSWSCAPNLRANLAAQLTLCSAWGLARALQEWAIPVQIKWPNDLVLMGRKLGGILTETRLRGDTIQQAVIGVGINWANPVPAVGTNLQTFWAEQAGSTREPPGLTPTITSLAHLAAIVLQGLLTGYDHWQQQGMADLLPAYEALLNHRDRSIQVAGQPMMIVGITPAGGLRVHPLSPSGEAAGADREQILHPGQIRLGYDVNELEP